MDKFSNSQKFEILKQALEERYSAMRVIRDRIQSIALRILPITLWCSWYLFTQRFYPICKFEKILLMIVVFFVYICIIYYIKDLEKWFNWQREVASKIEKNFLLFEKDSFIDWDSVYPSSREWIKKWNYINLNCVLITLWFVILIISILLYL